jgi:hypothetical protein
MHGCYLLLQTRSIKTLEFGGSKEIVYERSDYPREKILNMFNKEKFAVVGYGTQVIIQFFSIFLVLFLLLNPIMPSR